MKKKILFFGALALLLGAVMLSACGGQEEEPGPGGDTLKTSDYFPINENTRYAYEGVGNEFAQYESSVEYTANGYIQYRVNNGGTVQAKVVALKDGKATQVFLMNEVYYRENMLDRTNQEEVLLMEPIEQGTAWTLPDGRTRKITELSVEVETPSGNYEAIEVVTEGSNGKATDYYAKDVGLVKSVFHTEGVEITSSLKSIERNLPRRETLRFHLPNLDAGKIYYVERPVDFRTNEGTAETLAAVYREAGDKAPDELGQVLTEGAKINTLTLNEKNQVLVDLNEAFVSEMNAGAAYESMILQSLANTFAGYYGVEEVLLTVEGKPYASGHIEMETGEVIKRVEADAY